MKIPVYAVLLATGLSFGLVVPALAHHSHAMFDHTTTVTITGTVSNVAYRNPHAYLWVDVPGEDGQVDTWTVELSNIQNMIAVGVGGSTFKVGDLITVLMNPLDNGGLGGNYISITDADGRTYGRGRVAR